jgi:thiopeptide-type bacteriocin biosynthesis protein
VSDAWGWLQVDIGLSGPPGAPPPAPWRDLRSLVEGWWSLGRVDHAAFVRKPPGLRLRVAGTALAERVEVDLVTLLARAERAGAIRGWRHGCYEPETARFGGDLGMAVGHEHFDQDALVALRYETLSGEGRRALPRAACSAAVVGHLLRLATGDAAEALDVWLRLRDGVAAHDPPPSEGAGVGVECALLGDSGWVSSVPDDARELLDVAAAGNARFAERLAAVVGSGRVDVGTRALLAAVIVFHWNRLGLGAGDALALCDAAIQVLRPDEGAPW